MKGLIVSLLAALSFSGCAMIEQANQDYLARTCNYDGAFEAGANAAREKQPMSGSNLAGQCPEASRAAVGQGYRAGYTSVANQPVPVQPAPLIVVNPPSQTYPGQTYPGQPYPAQECKTSFGRRVCGYGCKEAYGQVRCASRPNHRCIDSYGKIYCGLNCREEYGKVVCDEWD